MSRDLTSAIETALAAGVVRPVLFYQGEFATGTLRLWSGVGPITWNAQTWTGAGNLLGISAIQETTDTRATGLTCQLSGLPSSVISLVLTNARQGKPGSVWLGLLDSAGAVIADPALAFQGRLDVPAIEESGETCTVSVSYESRLIDLERARDFRYTSEDQQIDNPDDRGFDFVPSIQEAVISWGRG